MLIEVVSLSVSMKKFKAITVIFLAFLMLVSGSGFAVFVHKCGASHEVETDLFSRTEGCCSEEFPAGCNQEEAGIQAGCCELKISYQKIDIPSSGGFFKPVVSPISFSLPATFSIGLTEQSTQIFGALEEDPPPLRSLFRLFSCLLI